MSNECNRNKLNQATAAKSGWHTYGNTPVLLPGDLFFD